MKRRTLLASCAGGLATGMLPFTRAASAATTWNCYTYVPAATLAGARGMQKIVADVVKATHGGLDIKLSLAGSLPINSTNITQAVSSGVMQMGDDGLYQGNIPIAGILQLPMLMNTPQEFATALKIMQPDVERAYAAKGVIVLGTYYYPLQVAWSRDKLESLADLRNQKMRVTSPEQAAFVRAFGGIPVTLGADEVPSALDRGVIQGVFTASAGGGKIWHDLLKYSYRLGPNYFNAYIIANKTAFSQLSAGDQAALKRAVAGVTPWETKTLYREETEVTAQLRKDGMIITDAKAADIQLGTEKMKGYWAEWAKGQCPEAVKALAKIRAALKH